MKVKKLKELLTAAPDDMEVYIIQEAAIGGFIFKPACDCESKGSGITGIPAVDENGYVDPEGEVRLVFALVPHGIGVVEGEEPEESNEPTPELN